MTIQENNKNPTFYKVGRRHFEYRITPIKNKVWNRIRFPFTRRHLLKWRGTYNISALKRERVLKDKMPLWWLLGLGFVLIVTPFLSPQQIGVSSIFCIYASINILWTLIVGTAGIFSFATLAVLGVSGYIAAAANVYFDVPWPFMFIIGSIVGLIFGTILAAPSTRLDGLYYALLTIGIAEICRVFVLQLRVLAPQNGSITKVDSFIPDELFLQPEGMLIGFYASFILLLFTLLIWRLINSERLGLLLRTAKNSREDESFAEAIGIDFRRARLYVFIISSSALGFVGAFYAMYYKSISPTVFSIDQLMMLFAMMVIGGIGRAEGAVVGAAIVTIIDKGLIELGPVRIIIIAAIMLIVTIIGREGITGARKQFRAFRYRKSGERRALRTEKNGEVMPEEATEIFDKQEIYFRRFNKRLRENLKKMVTPELIEEHRINPTGNHSDKLSRVLNYFRRAETTDKYGIKRVIKNKSFIYKIIAFSGRKTHPPRNVDDKEYDKLSEALHAVFILRVNDLLES